MRYPSPPVLDGISALVDQSLIRRLPNRDDKAADSDRFAMLETIRAFALERLDGSGEADAVHRAHAAWVLDLAGAAEAGQQTPERATWHRRLDAEHDNARAALGWALERGEHDTALRIAAALWGYWETRGYLSEGRAWLERALLSADGADPRVVAAARRGAGALARDQGDLDRAQEHGEAALRLFEAGGDERGIAAMLINLGNVALDRGDAAEAAGRYAAALERSQALGHAAYTALALNNLGLAEATLGRGEDALARYDACLALAVESGDDRLRAMVLDNLGRLALRQGDLDRAESLHRESLELRLELGDRRGIETSLRGLARLALARGDARQAAELSAESLALAAELGDRDGAIADLERIAALVAGQAPETAARFIGAAGSLRAAIGLEPTDDERGQTEQTLRALGGALPAIRIDPARAAGRGAPLARLAADARDATAAFSAGPAPLPSPSAVRPAGQPGGDAGLSPRELEILRLVADGLPDREIAETLFISPRTVGGHVTGILNKLGVNSRAAAAAYAVRHGLA